MTAARRATDGRGGRAWSAPASRPRAARPPEAVGLPAGSGGDEPPRAPAEAIPYVREEQERRAAAAERQLARLGKVNPLALEEFAALQERHQFLATQLEDLRKTRRDLLTVVKEVDDRVQEVFAVRVRGHGARVRGAVRAAVPGRRGTAAADRAGRHADHRHRDRGPAAGQEGQAAVAAVRRRAVADRDRLPVRDLQGPAVAVLRARRGGGGARRQQPAAAAAACSRSCGKARS